MEYIIVQAGGKGTRLKHLTSNKPKALVPIENKPMLFHLFSKYPDKRFVIIADYKKEVMREYLDVFASVKYQVIDTCEPGTCAGIKNALELIPENEPFMLIWSDLILPESLQLPGEYGPDKGEVAPKKDYVGISLDFPCRWSFVDGQFAEKELHGHGVAGLFLFAGKEKLSGIPESGEFVRWLRDSGKEFGEVGLAGTKEFGVLEEYYRLDREKCRPFNKITVQSERIIKEGIDERGRKLAERECAWYGKAQSAGISEIPHIYGTDPIEMEYIAGKNVYEYHLTKEEKKKVLGRIVQLIKKLHESDKISADTFSCREAYFNKTFDRIRSVRDLVPFANEKFIMVNGRKCRNVFYFKRELEERLSKLRCDKFCFTHGDCTFSNIMLRNDESPVLIDPRGYFGFTELYGDPLYDWAKLYYSIVGNYDRFNLKEFRLKIGSDGVEINVNSNNWEDMESDFFELTQTNPTEVKLLHAVIWLSLTTYAWHDYDSICGAFYNGIYYLEEIL